MLGTGPRFEIRMRNERVRIHKGSVFIQNSSKNIKPIVFMKILFGSGCSTQNCIQNGAVCISLRKVRCVRNESDAKTTNMYSNESESYSKSVVLHFTWNTIVLKKNQLFEKKKLCDQKNYMRNRDFLIRNGVNPY